MAVIDPISPLPPTAPSRAVPVSFRERMDDFLAWMVGFVTSLNVAIGQFNAAFAALAAGVAPVGSVSAFMTVVLALDEPGARSRLGISRNRLINPDGRIYQRTAASTADDAYTGMPDRWYALTQTAAITPSQLTDVAAGLPFMIRLTQAQASAQRMGMAQAIQAKDCKDMRGRAVVLAGKVRCSAAQAIRYAILEWTGTADALTSDVVSAWTNGSFTAGQFFNSTTLNVLAVGAITPAAATLTDITELQATVGAAANNLVVMFWSEGTLAQNATLDLAQLRLIEGVAAPAYEPRDDAAERALCEQFYWRSNIQAGFGAAGNYQHNFPLTFPTRMRVTPTMSFVPGAAVNAGGINVAGMDAGAFYFSMTATVAGSSSANGTAVADAEL